MRQELIMMASMRSGENMASQATLIMQDTLATRLSLEP